MTKTFFLTFLSFWLVGLTLCSFVCRKNVYSSFWFFLLVHMQVTERKLELAKLEAIDCGKPLEEAAWDIVCIWELKGTILCRHSNMYLRVHFWLLLGWCRRMFWVLCWSCWSFGSKAEESYFSSSGYDDMPCAEGTYWCSWFNYSMVLTTFFFFLPFIGLWNLSSSSWLVYLFIYFCVRAKELSSSDGYMESSSRSCCWMCCNT